jgi:hypothetical protein
MPKGIRHLIRFPGNNSYVRAVLSQELKQRVSDWEDQIQRERRSLDGRPGFLDRQPTVTVGHVGAVGAGVNNGVDRRRAVDAYIKEVFDLTGKRITRTDIWKKARYRSRAEFERWQRCDARATRAANERFARILAEKPHLR